LSKFDQWSSSQLDHVESKEDRQALATYIAWHHRHRILRHLDNGTLRPSAWSTARQQTRVAVTFLNWLKDRGLTLAECTQHDIDDWFASGPTTHLLARTFMTFAVRRRLCPNLRLPAPPKATPDAQPQQERIALIRCLFTDDTLPAIDRVAGLLVLLYAQPAARITHLQVDDVTISGDQVRLRIAEEGLPLPEPLDQLTTTLITQRRNMGTAANPTSPWLFPGQRPNRASTASQLRKRLSDLGITRISRTAAFNQLLREIPAPVLADLVGCHPRFAAERATALATGWDNYAALRAAQYPPHRRSAG
jgi:hypothetical protein